MREVVTMNMISRASHGVMDAPQGERGLFKRGRRIPVFFNLYYASEDLREKRTKLLYYY